MTGEQKFFAPKTEQRYKVAGSTSGALDDAGINNEVSVEEQREQLKNELEEVKQNAQRLIDHNRFNFELFAESAAPRFVFSDGFYMLFEKKEVHMNTKWFFDRKFSDEQLVWATYHELAHFFDFTEDNRAILRKFEDIQKQAKGTGSQLEEKFRIGIPPGKEAEYEEYFEQKPVDPKKPERGTMNRFESQAYGIHHEFWNIVDDIYVNSLVAKRKSVYGEGGAHAEAVKNLYREQLFKEHDFSSLPRHKQYMYALIRQAMVPDEEVLVNDEIQGILARKLQIGGKEKTATEIVREYIQSRGSIGRKAGMRYLNIEVSLEPVFQELLQKDILEWDPKMPEEKANQEEHSESQESGQSNAEASKNNAEKNDDGDTKNDGDKSDSGKEDGGNQSREGDEKEGDERGDHTENGQGETQPDEQSSEGDQGKEVQSGAQSGKSMQENIDDVFNPTKGGQKPEGKEGRGKPGTGTGSGPSIPRPIESPEDLKNILDILNEGKKEWQEAKKKEIETQEQGKKSENEIRNAMDALRKKKFAETWADEFEMTPEQFEQAEREYEETEQKIQPYLVALDSLWQRIIYGRSQENVTESASRFKTGVDIDIDEVVRQFSEVVTGDLEKVRVMTRTEIVREFVERPELIRVRFVGDTSGSMNDERREILKQAFVLIFTSLRRFETFLNLSRGRTKSKLSVDTEAWMFGSEATRVKSFRGKTAGYEREKASIVASFAGLESDQGGTRDDKALVAIDASLTSEEAKKIKAKKIMELVFELTDGGTANDGISSAKKVLEALDEKGVITRAFQIGTTDANERAIFENVWNADTSGQRLPESKRRGYIVGAELKDLIPALTASLAKHLGSVEL